jgi:hypothetical protein
VKYGLGPSIAVRTTGNLPSKPTLTLLVAPINLPTIRRAGYVILCSTQRTKRIFRYIRSLLDAPKARDEKIITKVKRRVSVSCVRLCVGPHRRTTLSFRTCPSQIVCCSLRSGPNRGMWWVEGRSIFGTKSGSPHPITYALSLSRPEREILSSATKVEWTIQM